MGRQEMATNKAVIEVANKLYWDPKTLPAETRSLINGIKTWISTAICSNSIPPELTYDLQSITADELVRLLPVRIQKMVKTIKNLIFTFTVRIKKCFKTA